MCIPIELDVPVMTLDSQQVGIAREILCPCPGEVATSSSADPEAVATTYSSTDLWLRVTRPLAPDLYIPFGEIAETRTNGVLLRVIDAGAPGPPRSADDSRPARRNGTSWRVIFPNDAVCEPIRPGSAGRRAGAPSLRHGPRRG